MLFTAGQSFGSQDYYNKFLLTILGLAGVLFWENEQTYKKWIIVCSEENTLTFVLWKLGGEGGGGAISQSNSK